MNARQHAEIDRRARELRRAELARMAADLACLASRAYAALRRRTVTSTCSPRKSPGAPNHDPVSGAA